MHSIVSWAGLTGGSKPAADAFVIADSCLEVLDVSVPLRQQSGVHTHGRRCNLGLLLKQNSPMRPTLTLKVY